MSGAGVSSSETLVPQRLSSQRSASAPLQGPSPRPDTGGRSKQGRAGKWILGFKMTEHKGTPGLAN